VLDWLIDYKKRRRLIALRGNHEIMMLNAKRSGDAVEEWLRCGGRQTLASYNGLLRRAQLKDIPDKHWAFLETGLRDWFETETHFFVHANAYADCSLEDQPEFMLFWEHLNAPVPHQSGKIMICGHTPQTSGRPFNAGHAVCLDTNACRGGWLTCLDVASGQYWQANEQGQNQSGWLEDI
jgi:serine/threonine protein phosphatase 1